MKDFFDKPKRTLVIGEAERKSATICEYCGTTEDVKLYTDGWHTTICKSCRNKK